MPRFFGGRTIMKHAIGEDATALAGGGEVPGGAAGVPEAARRPLRRGFRAGRILAGSRIGGGGPRVAADMTCPRCFIWCRSS
jgi:hypothetical protein